MANVNFIINRNRIFLDYYFGPTERFRYYVKEKITGPNCWDKRKQRVNGRMKHNDKINELLDTIENYVTEVRLEARINNITWNSQYLRKMMEERMKGKSNEFYTYAITWLEGKQVKPVTIKTYSISVEIINRTLPGLTFNSISRHTKNTLYKSLKETGYKVNYINRIFKVFWGIINDAYIDSIHENKFHLSSGFVPGTEEVENIYLTLADLDTLYILWRSHELAPYHHNALNIFLRGCYTGQRWQTYSKYTPFMIYNTNGVDMISIKQEKVNHSVSIPVSDKFRELMKETTHNISQQKLNDYIKYVCRKAGIKEPERVSSHTARRTFATNMVLAGVDITKIMTITGHKTEKEFRKYVKMDGVLNATNTIHEINQVFG